MSPLLWTALALAAPPQPEAWWVGLPIADVALVAPRGGLPEESLEPLLRAERGQVYSANTVRLDLATLFRVGEFAAVEASARPWAAMDDAGEVVPGVLLTYTILPPPRIARVHVQSQGHVRASAVLDAADVPEGSVFYGDLDGPRTAERVRKALIAQGFPAPEVEADAMPLDDGTLELWLRVAEGTPQRLISVSARGDLPVPERRITAWARHEGLRPGKPLAPAAVQAAQYSIRQRLATGGRNPWSLTRAWFQRRELGWLGARVGAATTTDDEGVQVTFTVEAGPLLSLDVTGVPWRGPQRVQEALHIDERTRLTRGFLEAAPDRLAESLRRQGFLNAQVTTSLLTEADGQVLRVAIEKGARHTLRDRFLAPPESEARGLVFLGNATLPDWQLRAVLRQASPDVVRSGYVTPPELAKGLVAVREQYAAAGYHEAQVTLEPLRTDNRRSLWALPVLRSVRRAVTASPPRRWVQAIVHVDEGALTSLHQVTLTGGADDLDLEELRAKGAALADGPWAPARLQALAQAVLNRHRDAGYLDATVHTVIDDVGDHAVSAELIVDPGDRVLLRSAVMRGLVHTRASFARKQIDLTLTSPVSEADLQHARSNLDDLGIFRTVQTELLGDELARDLVIGVEERPRTALELGGGVSTDEGFRLFGRYTRRNLLRVAHRFDLNTYVGLPAVDLSTYELRAAATYTAPHFPARREDLELDALLQDRSVERGWELARSGGGVTFNAALNPHTQLRVGARVEWRRLLDVDPAIILPTEAWAGLINDANPWRPAHSASLMLLRDHRDDPVNPSRGSLVSAQAVVTPAIGDATRVSPMVKVDASARGVIPFPSGPSLHLSAEAGHAEALGDKVIALEDRYRLGGTGSLRGFARDTVGPRAEVDALNIAWPDGIAQPIATELAAYPTRWVSIGGDTRASVSAELLLPLPTLGLPSWEGYAVALFGDVGNTWLLDPRVSVSSDQPAVTALVSPAMRTGLGVGLRMDTPVGPMRVDIAVNPLLLFASGDRATLLHDGWRETAVRPHLSLGTLL